ncbi:MAG TPA: hypothetical protein VIH93_06650, partial [Thermoanaerobaculia bacterium]
MSAGGGPSLPAFFWRYLRRYLAWAALAAVSILVFAVATAAIVSLIEPIFGEVLLTSQTPEVMGIPVHHPAKAAPDAGPLAHFAKKLNVAEQIDRGYRSLKHRLGVGPAEVVYFVPFLLVVVFLLRSLADFVAGY